MSDDDLTEALRIDRDGWRTRAHRAEAALEELRAYIDQLPRRGPGVVVVDLTEDSASFVLGPRP